MRRYGRIAAAREAFAVVGAEEALLALGEDSAARGDVQEAIRCFVAAHAPRRLENYAARLRAEGDVVGAADALELAARARSRATSKRPSTARSRPSPSRAS